MAELLTKESHIVALYDAAKFCGIDPATLTATNPFGHAGARAVMIQEAIQEQDPVIAAEMRLDAGIVPNLAAVREQIGGGEISESSRQELIRTDPKFAKSELAKAKAQDAEFMKGMEKAGENLRLQRFMQQAGGNEARARHLLQQEDAVHARQQQEMQQMGVTFGRAN